MHNTLSSTPFKLSHRTMMIDDYDEHDDHDDHNDHDDHDNHLMA